MHKATVNIHIQMCVCGCKFSFIWGKYNGAGFLGHVMGTFNSVRNCQTFSKVAASVYSLSSNGLEF